MNCYIFHNSLEPNLWKCLSCFKMLIVCEILIDRMLMILLVTDYMRPIICAI